jgi:uncharacterized protein YjbI with pentapeptide repeats
MARDGEDLSGRDLSGADLSGSSFKGVDLSGADLHGANLQGGNFKHANLTDADLSDADLSGANLKNATLVGADLDGATLAGTNLKHAVFEEGESENGADDSLSSLVGSVVTGAVITVGVALLVAGWSDAWVVFVVGLVAVLPASVKLAEWYESRGTDEDSGTDEEVDEQQAALATLRDRYANGEIDEAEFERRVERLLETESVADAETAYGSAGATEAKPEQESEPTDTDSGEPSETTDIEREKEPE